jgi:hypothetical protein
MVDVVNRYASQDLFIDQEIHERLGSFVSRAERDNKPFSRQVDAWWAAMCLGVRMGRPTPARGRGVKFMDGAILSTDPWRITQLELLALSVGSEAVLDDPPAVIKIATGYANTGFPWLLDQMLGQAEPTLALMIKLSAFDELEGL